MTALLCPPRAQHVPTKWLRLPCLQNFRFLVGKFDGIMGMAFKNISVGGDPGVPGAGPTPVFLTMVQQGIVALLVATLALDGTLNGG